MLCHNIIVMLVFMSLLTIGCIDFFPPDMVVLKLVTEQW